MKFLTAAVTVSAVSSLQDVFAFYFSSRKLPCDDTIDTTRIYTPF